MSELTGSYNLFLVVLSFLISWFGSLTSLQLARLIAPDDEDRHFWAGSAALAMGGCAIWSMHFIAMVALDLGITVRYDAPLTLASLALAWMATFVGFAVVGSRPRATPRLVAGGVLMGMGISGMHYLGMAAMRMPARLAWDSVLVAASIGIAVLASIAALRLAFARDGRGRTTGGAVLLAVAVCGMHYTGMAAATFLHDAQRAALRPPGLSPEAMAYGVFLISLVVLSIGMAISSPARRGEARPSTSR